MVEGVGIRSIERLLGRHAALLLKSAPRRISFSPRWIRLHPDPRGHRALAFFDHPQWWSGCYSLGLGILLILLFQTHLGRPIESVLRTGSIVARDLAAKGNKELFWQQMMARLKRCRSKDADRFFWKKSIFYAHLTIKMAHIL